MLYFDSKLADYEIAADYYREFDLPVPVVLPRTAVGWGNIGISITRLVYLTYTGKLKFTLPGGTSFVSAEDVAEGVSLHPFTTRWRVLRLLSIDGQFIDRSFSGSSSGR